MSALTSVRCPDVENGVDWLEFLELACRYCAMDQPCERQPFADPLVDVAWRIVEKGQDVSFTCVPGLIAAMIVSAQYYLTRNGVPPEEDALLSQNISLAPFPFHTLQYSMYSNMVPARYSLCRGELSQDMSNIFVPRVHPENSGLCGLVFNDEQLVRRCRTRIKFPMRHRDAEPVSEIVDRISCPSSEGIDVDSDPELARKLKKYEARGSQPAQHCQHSRGMWHSAMSDIHKCVLVTVAHFLNFRPGQLLLDWGSGCGHKMTWAKTLFDVDGVGLDIQGGPVAWARDHSMGKFCQADGRELDWLPDNVFDYVFSYASLYHLAKADQCRAGIQLISKLRVGGKAWWGWNQAPNMTHWDWRNCLLNTNTTYEDLVGPAIAARAREMEVDIEAMEDGFIFPPGVREARLHYLFQYPAYSLLITRMK